MVRATCLMQEGDQPVKYSWYKDGRPLDPSLKVRTSLLDSFTSIMLIDRVSAEHSGNYTCAATNAATTSTTSAMLTVRGNVLLLLSALILYFHVN